MTDWLKLSECKYTPSEMFCLFDYTKLVYMIDRNFYLKQIVSPGENSSFIEIKHDFDKVLSINWCLENIVSLEKKGDHFYVCFYSINSDQYRIRINWQLQENSQHQIPFSFQVHSIYHNKLLIVTCTCNGIANQIVFVDCEAKCIVARGFVQGLILDFSKGPNESISLQIDKRIVAYKNQPTPNKDVIGRIYRQTEADLSVQIKHHFWIEDQLFAWGKNKGYIIIKNKVIQQFNQFHKLQNAVPIICGFIACDGCIIKVYKKKNIKYELICQFIDENLMECKNLTLSPQEDILAYFSPVSSSIVISNAFNVQVEEAQLKDLSTTLSKNLEKNIISHEKSYDFTVYSSCQTWFIAANGTQIKLINSNTYDQYISIQLAGESKQNNFLNSSDLKPRHIAIHPNRPIFAVALKKSVRLYYVTFNEIKLVKQLNVSMCGFLLFNHSGTLLTAVISGKKGAKLYVFKLNQLKSQFLLLETITISKKPVSILWDALDSNMYCFFENGYYKWSIESKLKERKQVEIQLGWNIEGATLSQLDQPILWNDYKVKMIQEEQSQQQQIKMSKIKYIFHEDDYFYVVFQDGIIGRNKNLDIETCYSKGTSLSTEGKKFQIRLQQSHKFILLTSDLNMRFYQTVRSGSESAFNQIVGIDRKKLYQIMRKHKMYDDQIRKIREQFTLIIQEVKAKMMYDQKLIEEQYKTQLKDHIDRQKQVKEQKNKMEETMEKNLQIKEKQTMGQIKDLQRLYQRKIALTTNKLLTEKEINFRDKTVAENRLKVLEQKHYTAIEEIRNEFSDHLKLNMTDKQSFQRQIVRLKKDYQIRIFQLQEENQILIKNMQDKNEGSIVGLKKMVNNWENKYSECVSQKDNVQRQYQEQVVVCEILNQKISFLETKKAQSERRCQTLSNEVTKVQKILQDRNKLIQHYEKRMIDLQKSNEILKYRVLEVKQKNDPYEQEVTSLKENLTDLEQQYDSLLKNMNDQQAKISVITKEKIKYKEDFQVINQKYLKLIKRYQQLIDKIREATKSPIQQIRKQLLALVDSYTKINRQAFTHKRADSPLGELNRIRDHLQVCLDEAMSVNKRNQEQRKIEVMKKNRQNSELITQINEMRKKIRILEDQIKEKNLKISRLMRGDTPTIVPIEEREKEKLETTEAQSKEFGKTRSRETFYEKNMFKSGNHWNKRLKTEEGGGRRKKNSHSMLRERYPNHLVIQSGNEEIEEYKRIIEQKDLFIQKLIAKIQKG